MRGPPQHFVHSKVMCWVALDRAVGLREHWPFAVPLDRWETTCDEIHDAIVDQGWSDRAGAYTQAFGSDVLDASALTLAIVGFLPATDPRMSATIDADNLNRYVPPPNLASSCSVIKLRRPRGGISFGCCSTLTGGGHLDRRRLARKNLRLASRTSRRDWLCSSAPIPTSTQKCKRLSG